MSPLASLRTLGIGRNHVRPATTDRRLRQTLRLQGLEDRVVPAAVFTASDSSHITPALAGDITSATPIDVIWQERTHVHVKISASGDELQWKMYAFTITPNMPGMTVTTSGASLTIDGVPGLGTSGAGPYSLLVDPVGTATGAITEYAYLTLNITVSPPSGGGGGGGSTPKTHNLKVDSVEVPADYDVAPGEKVKFYLNLSNNGTGVCQGKTVAHVMIGTDMFDVPISINIPAGGTQKKLPIKLDMPKLSLNSSEELDAGDYDPAVTIDPIAGETDTTDNSGAATAPLQYAYCFGDIDENAGAGGAAFSPDLVNLPPEKLQTVEGETFVMHGPGKGQLVRSAGGWELTFFDTDAKSVAMATGKVPFHLAAISSSGAIKTLNMPTASATGQLTFQGGLKELDILNLGDGSTDTLLLVNAASGNPLTLDVAKSISHASITANGGIAKLEAGEWINPAAPASPDALQAPYIVNIAIKSAAAGGVSGNFVPDVNTSGTDPKRDYSLKKALIGGTVSGVWRVGTVLDEIYANQAADWYLESTGAVNRVGVGTTYDNSNTSSPGLQAVNFREIDLFGEVNMGGIEATDTAPGESISLIKVHNPHATGATATYLPVTATGGTIDRIIADNWPSTAAISTKAIGTILQSESSGTFQADLTLTDPDTDLESALIHGTLGYQGPNPNGHSDWTFAGSIGNVVAVGGIQNWNLQGSDATGHLVGLRSDGDFRNSTITVFAADSIRSSLFVGSTINITDELGSFIAERFDSTNVTAKSIKIVVVADVNNTAASSYAITAKGIVSYHRLAGHKIVKSLQEFPPGTDDQDGTYSLVILP